MRLTILTAIAILSLILSTQVAAFYVQYKINRTYRGIGLWLIGSSLMGLSFILMLLVGTEHFDKIAMIVNPLLILGHLFIYMGIQKFLKNKISKWTLSVIFIAFNISYYYYMIINNSISARTVVISIAIAIIAFMIAYQLFLEKESLLSATTNFTGSVFLIYSAFNILRIFHSLANHPINSYEQQSYSIIITMVISIVVSNLWTLGLIIMVNQRLNQDNQLKKEKLQLLFNTSIDSQLITRLKDGFVVDVNDEFSVLSGYSKDEVIGTCINGSILWVNLEDRLAFTTELNDKGVCKNKEYVFKRKDGSQFTGMISARILEIQGVAHIISVIRDITKDKEIQLEMKKLMEQLQVEKNTAQLNAITDSLSGLFNRGYFDNTLRAEFARLTRSGSKLSLIMLDIDYFKNFNDTYGHMAGDKCIQMIATSLQTTVERASDVVARYGGEEFIIILPETDQSGAKLLGEKIRKAIGDLAIPHQTSEAAEYVTVSVGVTTAYPSEFQSPEQILKLVDEALYFAKESGRNCSVYKSSKDQYIIN